MTAEQRNALEDLALLGETYKIVIALQEEATVKNSHMVDSLSSLLEHVGHEIVLATEDSIRAFKC